MLEVESIQGRENKRRKWKTDAGKLNTPDPSVLWAEFLFELVCIGEISSGSADILKDQN